ncbi:hypothetical protein HYR99_37815 [Candidatus Poribacteria bacterium]|nr:hypothetical protein [Candidatus Poribacteria bacterium]
MKSLDDYLKQMRTNDVVKAIQEARTKNMALLNDHGIAAIAVLFSDVLAEVIQSPEILLSKKEIANAFTEQRHT